MAEQVACALLHCHTQCILHNDVQLRHVLVDSNTDAKLKGFELALLTTDRSPKATALIPMYTAPEVLKDGTCSTRSDVYAYGLFLWELANRGAYKSHESLSLLQLVKKVCSGHVPEMPNEWPLGYRVIIHLCLLSDPNARPDMAMIKKEVQSARLNFIKSFSKETPSHNNKSRRAKSTMGPTDLIKLEDKEASQLARIYLMHPQISASLKKNLTQSRERQAHQENNGEQEDQKSFKKSDEVVEVEKN